MANDFSSDSNCKALWRLEDGALTTDSKGTNTLTNSNVTAETVDYKEGSGCGDFTAGASTHLYITDGDLDSGFPGKSGEANGTFSICFWVKFNSLPSPTYFLVSKWHVGDSKRCYEIGINNTSGTTQVLLALGTSGGGGASIYKHASAISTGIWYHLGITFDNNDKSYRIRIWDDNASSILGFDETGTAANALNIEDATFAIGDSSALDSTYQIDGLFDEIVVFNDVLSADEIDEVRAGTYGVVTTEPDTLALGMALNAPAIVIDYTALPDTLTMGLTLNAPTIVTTGDYEDFTTFTEVDEQPALTVDSTHKVSCLNYNGVQNTGYFYKDYGVNHFNGDFVHRFEAYISACTEAQSLYTLQNIVGDWLNNYGSPWSQDALSIFFQKDYLGTYRIIGELIENGAYAVEDDSVALSLSTLYYITVVRDDDGGANSTGRITVYIRTGSHSGVLVDTLQFDCSAGEQNNYRYINILSSLDVGYGDASNTGYVQNLALNEIVNVTIYPDTLTASLTLNAPTLTYDYVITPGVQGLGLTLNAPTVVTMKVVTPDILAMGLTLNAPDILISSSVSPPALLLGLTLNAPTIVIDYTIIPDTITMGLTLNAPTVVTMKVVTPDALTLGMTLNAPDILISSSVSPPALLLGLTLNAPTTTTATPCPCTDEIDAAVATIEARLDTIEDTLSTILEDTGTTIPALIAAISADTGKVVYGSIYSSTGEKKTITAGSVIGFVSDEKEDK